MYLPQSNAVCVHWTPMFFVPLWVSRSISGFHLQHVGNFRWRFFSCHVNSWLTRSHRIVLGATMTFVHCIGLQLRAINDAPLSSWKLMSRQSYFSHWRQLQHVSFTCSRTATMRRANKKRSSVAQRPENVLTGWKLKNIQLWRTTLLTITSNFVYILYINSMYINLIYQLCAYQSYLNNSSQIHMHLWKAKKRF